ncbi:MAG: hypothetical protein CM15mP74_28080 [Halieaceae bacterium]|nr:MAG: hypothetical protein CM15mP74_28080 [Halieaceae bacterium]
MSANHDETLRDPNCQSDQGASARVTDITVSAGVSVISSSPKWPRLEKPDGLTVVPPDEVDALSRPVSDQNPGVGAVPPTKCIVTDCGPVPMCGLELA